jgi:hypothetical protein
VLGDEIEVLQLALKNHAEVSADTLRRTSDILDQLRFHAVDVSASAAAQHEIELARILMAALDPAGATTRLDHLFSRYLAERPAVEGLGLDEAFVEVVDQRMHLATTATSGTILIYCEMDCRAFVDGQQVPIVDGHGTLATVPGRHDVWVYLGNSERAVFEEVEVTPSGQPGVIVSAHLELPPRPTPEQWWAASDWARRMAWAIEAKKVQSEPQPAILAAILSDADEHTEVLSWSRPLRELRVRALLSLADLQLEIGDDQAAESTISEVLRHGRLDGELDLAKTASTFTTLTPLIEAQEASLMAESGTLEVRCYQRCVTTIDGIKVEGEHFELPAARYDVELFSHIAGVTSKSEVIDVTRGGARTIEFGIPPVQGGSVPPPRNTAPSNRARRIMWGAAGGVTLGAGVGWSMVAATAAGALKFRDDAVDFGRVNAITGGLLAGILVTHTSVATIFFLRMPKSELPGMPMVAAGAGTVAFSLVLGGVAITAGVSTNRAIDEIGFLEGKKAVILEFGGITDVPTDEQCTAILKETEQSAESLFCETQKDIDRLQFRVDHGPTVAILSGTIGGALLITGSVLAIVGADRYRNFMQKPRRGNARKAKLFVAPSLSPRNAGLVLGGRF